MPYVDRHGDPLEPPVRIEPPRSPALDWRLGLRQGGLGGKATLRRSRGGEVYRSLSSSGVWPLLGDRHQQIGQWLALSNHRGDFFASLGSAGFRVVALAGLNAILLHCLYPLIKRRIGRPRPFRADPRLTSLLTVLDEHSFPSGHAMTLSGVLVPIVLVLPATILSAVALVCCMAWSRIATAHHYPSDIFAGVAMGVVLAYPLSTYLLAVW